jgi:hypothetical protein
VRGTRARAIEASTFALGLHESLADNAGHREIDAAFAQARTWSKQAHNLQLLTVYEQRIQRAVDKNMAQLKALQTERKQAAKEAMDQAKPLYQFPVPRQTLSAGGLFRYRTGSNGVCFFQHGNRPRTEPRQTAQRRPILSLRPLSPRTPPKKPARTARGGHCRLIIIASAASKK